MYILSNPSRTLYVGMTNDLPRRVTQHAEGVGSAFTRKYKVHQLVYFEGYPRPQDAIAREKEVKGWRREKKLALIESMNPHWEDLTSGLFS
jgi:putative endonuclease